MDKPMPSFFFRGMSSIFYFRDLIISPNRTVEEANLKPGYNVLDYGCGPGAYSIAAAEIVRNTGTVYALDIHPLAIKNVEKVASKKGLSNIKTICSDCTTGLNNNSIDVVFLYDIFHMLSERDNILKELHHVLKPNSILSLTNHHMKEAKMLSQMTKNNLFTLSSKGKKTYTFSKA